MYPPRLRRIGRGLQFAVYKKDDARVIKRGTTRVQKWMTPFLWKSLSMRSVLEEIRLSEKCWLTSSERMRALLHDHPEAGVLVGNPEFIDESCYEQDIAVPLAAYISSHTHKDTFRILDSYIDNLIECWRWGFSDTTFNFTRNNGIDHQGAVILLDFGELTFSQNHVAELLSYKSWLTRFSYASLKDPELRDYFAERMAARVTKETLATEWASRLRD